MKKVFAILSIVALASCNGNGASTVSTDSTNVDSALVADTVVVNDSILKVDSVELGGPQSGSSEVK